MRKSYIWKTKNFYIKMHKSLINPKNVVYWLCYISNDESENRCIQVTKTTYLALQKEGLLTESKLPKRRRK